MGSETVQMRRRKPSQRKHPSSHGSGIFICKVHHLLGVTKEEGIFAGKSD